LENKAKTENYSFQFSECKRLIMYKFIKRIIDILAASLALLILSPIYFIIARKVAKNIGTPVIFSQQRPGLHGKIFTMKKFRSMRDVQDEHDNVLPDHERLTEFGIRLRNSSLDELPGLWSVLKGDMSLVGPRPLLVEYLPLYSKQQARRHDAKPGITGWAQVNGRNAISWSDKFKLDVWYIDNQSLWLDIKIILLTVKKVFSQADINADGEVTMSKFTGQQ
tara:strand:+ start:45477 stop:46142 length:666 start_codon:yes stop_codon:yes gene_type:complete